METDKMIITLDDLVIEFASTMSLGMKAVKAAAETYVDALRRYPSKAAGMFAERFPSIRRETWAMLEDIGSGHLPPNALMMSPGAAQKLKDAKLPRTVAEKVTNSIVVVFNPAKNCYEDVRFTHLTESQADILLNPISHRIRTKDQQKRYIVRESAKFAPKSRPTPRFYAVTNDGVIFRKGAKLSFAELHDILKAHQVEAAGE